MWGSGRGAAAASPAHAWTGPNVHPTWAGHWARPSRQGCWDSAEWSGAPGAGRSGSPGAAAMGSPRPSAGPWRTHWQQGWQAVPDANCDRHRRHALDRVRGGRRASKATAELAHSLAAMKPSRPVVAAAIESDAEVYGVNTAFRAPPHHHHAQPYPT